MSIRDIPENQVVVGSVSIILVYKCNVHNVLTRWAWGFDSSITLSSDPSPQIVFCQSNVTVSGGAAARPAPVLTTYKK